MAAAHIQSAVEAGVALSSHGSTAMHMHGRSSSTASMERRKVRRGGAHRRRKRQRHRPAMGDHWRRDLDQSSNDRNT